MDDGLGQRRILQVLWAAELLALKMTTFSSTGQRRALRQSSRGKT